MWSLHQIGPTRLPLNIHQKDVPLKVDTNYLFLKHSIFENIKTTSISLEGQIPLTIESSSFRFCSDPTSSGCFFANLTNSASFALIKNCFVGCESPNSGVGCVYLHKSTATIAQCSIAKSVHPNQLGTVVLIGSIHQVESLNSSRNNIDSVPLITSDYRQCAH